MNKLYFGWDYYNYSKQPDISKVISEKFPDLRPDGTYPNDSDTLPLQDDNYVITNPWHQLTGILSGYGGDIELIHRDSLDD